MDIQKFLDTSYTAFHTVKNSREILQANGFVPYNDDVLAKAGGKYYIEKNASTIVAFTIGDLSHYAFNIAMAHTDSPVLRVKGRQLLDSPEGKRINVEVYGGLINYSIMDIPLKIAGRLFVKKQNGLQSVLVESDFNVNIPSLCIHHNSGVNEKANFTVQNDMLPLIDCDTDDLYSLLYREGEVLDGDLFVVPAVKSFYSGSNNQFLCSPRLDNLTSCYSCLDAIINTTSSGVSVACLFDNEEIGSRTKQGAFSQFLPNLLQRINLDLGKGVGDYLTALNNGFILSIDNGHAVHPAHPEKSDPKQRVYLNMGIVIKHHTNYSTDGHSSACIKYVFDKANVAYQDYYNNSDIRCGGTLGLIASANLEMNACDIGLAQLAMHSAIETVGADDIKVMANGVKAFYSAKFNQMGEDIVIK